MSQDPTKRKADLFKSIMSNPKLAKQFKEAINAPIGSTKRAQAKAIFSIMKKVDSRQGRGGMYDGQGGMLGDFFGGVKSSLGFGSSAPAPFYPTPTGSAPAKTIPNMIFPAAPKLKTTKAVAPAQVIPQGPMSIAPVKPVNKFVLPKVPTPLLKPGPMSYNIPKGANMSTPAGPVVAPRPVVNDNSGVVTKAKDWVTKTLWPAEAKTLSAVTPALIGAGEWAVRNALQVPKAIRNTLFGRPDVLNPDTKAQYVPFSKTWGGNIAGETLAPLFKDKGAAGQNIVTNPSNVQNPGWKNQFTGALADKDKVAATTETPVADPASWSGLTEEEKTVLRASKQGTPVDQYSGVQNAVNTAVSGAQGLAGGVGSAARNVMSALGINDPSIGLADVLKTYGPEAVRAQIIANEGGSPAGVVNNPGNIKFNNLEGQINSGVQATDGGTFASYATPEAGLQAIDDIINRAAAGQSSSYGSNPTIASFMNTYTNTGPGTSGGGMSSGGGIPTGGSMSDVIANAPAAVAAGMGPTTFGILSAENLIGGNLQEVIQRQSEQLKKDLGLEEKEQRLSDLRITGEELVPNLTDYIRGKDEYLKDIDQMIADAEDGRKDLDMGNPAVNKSYRDHLAYLYTLKGRQEGRYGNFLKSAVEEFNTDAAREEASYNQAQSQYTELMGQQSAITQSQYNNYATMMADLYTSLENAPTKQLNNAILLQQYQENARTLLENQKLANGTINPDYYKNKDLVLKDITYTDGDNKGALSLEKLGPSGIAGILNTSGYAQTDPQATIDAINQAIGMSLSTNGDAPGNISTVLDIKRLVDDFKSQDGWGDIASNISPVFVESASGIVGNYVMDNLSTFKDAVADIANGKVTSLSALSSKYPSIEEGLLETLLTTIPNTVARYGNDPKAVVSTIFSGSEVQVKNTLVSLLTSTW